MKGVPTHFRHENRLNREYQTSREPTPRQIDYTKAFAIFLSEQERQPTLPEMARILEVRYKQAMELRDGAIASGLLGSSGFAATRSLWVTAKGERAISAAKDESSDAVMEGSSG